MTERVKDHVGKPRFLPQLLKFARDDAFLARAAVGHRHHQIVILILVTEKRPKLVLCGFPFPQDISCT